MTQTAAAIITAPVLMALECVICVKIFLQVSGYYSIICLLMLYYINTTYEMKEGGSKPVDTLYA